MIRTAAAALIALSAPAFAEDGLDPAMRDAVDERVRTYILENPEVILEALDILESRRADERAAADGDLIRENAAALYEDGHSHVFGDPDGDVTIVEFADYRCGYCKAAHPQVVELLESDGAIRLVLKEFPILGQDSVLAARVAMAVLREDPEGYERLHGALMEHRGQLDEAAIFTLAEEAGFEEAALREAMTAPEIAEAIRANYALAQALGVEGTPSFVIGDRIVRGFVQIDQMRELVEAARAEAG